MHRKKTATEKHTAGHKAELMNNLAGDGSHRRRSPVDESRLLNDTRSLCRGAASTYSLTQQASKNVCDSPTPHVVLPAVLRKNGVASCEDNDRDEMMRQ